MRKTKYVVFKPEWLKVSSFKNRPNLTAKAADNFLPIKNYTRIELYVGSSE